MFNALFKPKFYSKCKSRLKLIKMRLETICKKRSAVQKFLKKDIADLLRSALDYNAYGRAEGVLVEQNLTFCYEIIGKFTTCILGHVGDLCKQRDCPAECKEAIQSLIYAAARFSDLPELRELRSLFTGKFGNSLELYISKEFVEKLRQYPPSKEMKIQLLHDVAQEFSIEWNSKALEQRLHSPPQLHLGKAKPDLLNDHEDHKNNDVSLFEGKKDTSDAYWRSPRSSTEDDNSSLDGHNKACSSSLGSVSEDETEIKRPFSYNLVPPPYVKQKLKKGESNMNKPTKSEEALKLPHEDNNTFSDSKTCGTAKLEDSSGKESEKAKKQPQQTKPAEEEKERTVDGLLMHYTRKQSHHPCFQHDKGPEMVRRTARHVHPSLPDYDDLLARLAALKKTTQPA
ncbi:IST1-like protein [Glycine soja]|uniref:IST1-like protein n=1 Tax=Glycine soja TaxID=3848 RepID=A0A445IF01_GLYSO|nr:IST1-like protein [Glycine soja]